MSYGIFFWDTATEVHKIFALQKKRGSSRKILILSSVCISTMVSYVDSYLFRQNSRYHEYRTRGRESIREPYHRLASTQKCVNYWGPKLYDRLPGDKKALFPIAFETQVKQMPVEIKSEG